MSFLKDVYWGTLGGRASTVSECSSWVRRFQRTVRREICTMSKPPKTKAAKRRSSLKLEEARRVQRRAQEAARFDLGHPHMLGWIVSTPSGHFPE